MFTWVKRLIGLSFVVGLLVAGSYAIARGEAGRVLGNRPPLSGLTAEFAFKGAARLERE